MDAHSGRYTRFCDGIYSGNQFQLAKEEKKANATQNTEIHEKALIIVGGVEKTNFDLQSIDAISIESISVLKDKSATDIYGEKGKYGVILITLKK